MCLRAGITLSSSSSFCFCIHYSPVKRVKRAPSSGLILAASLPPTALYENTYTRRQDGTRQTAVAIALATVAPGATHRSRREAATCSTRPSRLRSLFTVPLGSPRGCAAPATRVYFQAWVCQPAHRCLARASRCRLPSCSVQLRLSRWLMRACVSQSASSPPEPVSSRLLGALTILESGQFHVRKLPQTVSHCHPAVGSLGMRHQAIVRLARATTGRPAMNGCRWLES